MKNSVNCGPMFQIFSDYSAYRALDFPHFIKSKTFGAFKISASYRRLIEKFMGNSSKVIKFLMSGSVQINSRSTKGSLKWCRLKFKINLIHHAVFYSFMSLVNCGAWMFVAPRRLIWHCVYICGYYNFFANLSPRCIQTASMT